MYLKFGRTNSRLLYGQIPPSHRLCFPSCSVQDWYILPQYLNQANSSSRVSEHNRKTEAQQMRYLSWPRSTWPIVALSCIIFTMEDTEYRWNLLESLQITSIRYIALNKQKNCFPEGYSLAMWGGGVKKYLSQIWKHLPNFYFKRGMWKESTGILLGKCQIFLEHKQNDFPPQPPHFSFIWNQTQQFRLKSFRKSTKLH